MRFHAMRPQIRSLHASKALSRTKVSQLFGREESNCTLLTAYRVMSIAVRCHIMGCLVLAADFMEAHTISQRLRTLKKIPPELLPLGVVIGFVCPRQDAYPC
jgi:hypothetical protein